MLSTLKCILISVILKGNMCTFQSEWNMVFSSAPDSDSVPLQALHLPRCYLPALEAQSINHWTNGKSRSRAILSGFPFLENKHSLISKTMIAEKASQRELPGDPVTSKTVQGVQVWSLVWELRSHMPHSMAPKKSKLAISLQSEAENTDIVQSQWPWINTPWPLVHRTLFFLLQ